MIWLTDDEKRIVTTNVSSGSVSIIDKIPPRAAGAPGGRSQQPAAPSYTSRGRLGTDGGKSR